MIGVGNRRSVLIFALWLFLAYDCTEVHSNSPKRVRLAYSFISGSTLPLWIAKDEGLFKKNGLEVELIAIPGPSRVAQALVAGDVEVIAAGGPIVVLSALRGSGIKMFAGVLNVFSSTIFTARDITRPEQLKGKKVAISTFGSTAEFAVAFALRKYNVNAYKDITMLQIGDQAARFAALLSGAVDAAIINPPLTLNAKRLGYYPTVDLSSIGLSFPNATLASLSSYMRSHDDVLRQLMRAYVEALFLFHTREGVSVRALKKYMKVEDPEIAQYTVQVYRKMHPRKPYPSVEGTKFMLDFLISRHPELKDRRPEEFLEMKFVQELDQSGFIDDLYRKGN